MPVADLVILVVLALSIWRGFSRGLVREGLALAGWVIGLIVAINGYQSFAVVLAPFISTPSLQKATAFLVLCLSMVILSALIALVLSEILKALALRPVDKLAGGRLWPCAWLAHCFISHWFYLRLFTKKTHGGKRRVFLKPCFLMCLLLIK
ncbi:MAG: CvpA family protein [Moraxellaceae bacterium]|nr:CvpA family protein [Moraxellaceae bacterium]